MNTELLFQFWTGRGKKKKPSPHLLLPSFLHLPLHYQPWIHNWFVIASQREISCAWASPPLKHLGEGDGTPQAPGIKPGNGNNKVENIKPKNINGVFFKQRRIFVFLQRAGLPGTPKFSGATNEGESAAPGVWASGFFLMMPTMPVAPL